jgi:hypothetical protein
MINRKSLFHFPGEAARHVVIWLYYGEMKLA